MAKKETGTNVVDEPKEVSNETKRTVQEIIAISDVVAASKTSGIFTPDENLKWVAFYRQLKAITEETRSTLKDMYTQYDIVWIDEQHVDVRKTGEANWKNYQEAEKKLMSRETPIEIERFLTEDKVLALKDKNDYTTQVSEYLITLLVSKD